MTGIVTYLDLDGVEADYAAGMVALGYDIDPALGRDFNRSGTSHPLKREMYERIRGTDFYRHLPLQEGAVELYLTAQEVSICEPIILTAAPKFGATEDDYHVNPFWLGATYHKRGWVECVLLTAVDGARSGAFPAARYTHAPSGHVLRIAVEDEHFICTTSARKFEFMHRRPGAHQVLVDDRIANVTAWAEAGGIGIFHRSSDESITVLRLLHEALGKGGRLDEIGFEPVGDGYLYTGAA